MKVKRNLFMKMISAFLAALMIVQILPLNVLAADIINSSIPKYVTASGEKLEIEKELTSKSTDNEKVYLAKDGSFLSVTTFDENSNTMTLSNTEDTPQNETSSEENVKIKYYPEDNIDENGVFTIGKASKNCALVYIDFSNLGNAFVNDAKITLDCKEYDIDDTVFVAALSSKLEDGDTPECDDTRKSDYTYIKGNTDSISLDITKYCNECLTGKNNYGICICTDKYGYDFSNLNVFINYRNLSDVDSNIENEIIDMGRAGTVYINDFSCIPTVVRNELGLDGTIAPVQIQSILNTYKDASKITGSNFRINYASDITFDGECYVWNNCEGETLHFTYKTDNASYQTYIATNASGEEYTLKLYPESGSYNAENYENIRITDNDNYEYHFNANGFLSEILVNSNSSSKISVSYSEYSAVENDSSVTKYHISNITDGDGRVYIFEYTDNLLTKISANRPQGNGYSQLKINETDICISYSYDAQGRLTKVIYPDNEAVEYSYDDADRIVSIQSNNGNKLNLTYNNKINENINNKEMSMFMLTEYEKTDSNNNKLEFIGLDYSDAYRRTFTDKIIEEKPKTKILDFNKKYQLIYLENFDNSNYFLDYDNGSLKKVLNDSSINNLIKQGTFSTASGDNSYTNFWSKIGASIGLDSNHGTRLKSDDNCLRIRNAEDEDGGMYQEVSGDFKKGDRYIIEAYASAPDAGTVSDLKKFSVIVSSSDNTIGIPTQSETIARMDYQPYIESWQMQKRIITIPEDTEKLFVYLCYGYMEGYCFFDTVKLYKYEPDNAITDIDRTTYTYDDYGRLTKESVKAILLTKEKTYTYNGNVLVSSTENGVPTYYNYDTNNNLLMSTGKSKIESDNIQYSYNGIGALASVQQVVSQLNNETNSNLKNIKLNTAYTYKHDNITQVTHNGFTYDLSYDGYGNINNVIVNKTQLFTYDGQYKGNDHISKITYGDGTSLLYQESIDDNFYNLVNIYETKKTDPNININDLDYDYQFKYDYDGTLVEYIDKSDESDESNELDESENPNYTTSVWYGDTYVIYDSVNSSLLNEINSLLRGNNENIKTIDDISFTPIYRQTADSSIKLFNDNYSVNSKTISTDNTNTITTTSSLTENNETITESTVITTTDGFDRPTASTLSSGKMSIVNASTYKSSGLLGTTNLISSYNTYVQNYVKDQDKILPRLLKNSTYSYNAYGQISDVYTASLNAIPNTTNPGSDGTNAEKTRHYEYDELGQLIEEVDLDLNRAIIYYYDEGGNITEKRIYENSDSEDTSSFSFNKTTNKLTLNECVEDIIYEYDSAWGDLLTSFDGVEINYDNAGNPLNYYGNTMYGEKVSGTLNWSGKKLISFTDEKNERYYEYKYNADGLRTKKSIFKMEDGSHRLLSTMDYIWSGDTIVGYKITAYSSNGTADTEITMKPTYDSNGNIMGLMYSTRDPENQQISSSGTLAILRDGLGNITDLYSSDDSLSFHFNYDAYGNCDLGFSGFNIEELKEQLKDQPLVVQVILSFLYTVAIAAIVGGTIITTQQNYRGYLYDFETGLYYNQTRYYSPSWSRFINIDDVSVLTKDTGEVLGANLFKYCDNDPINYTDPSGFSKLSNIADGSLLSLIGIESNEATKLNISKTSVQNTIENKIIESSLNLTTTQQDVWSEVFDERPHTVFKKNGYNYLSSQVNTTGNDKATLFSVKAKSPYGTTTAFKK